ncbi:MAG: adenylosuccinate synthase [Vampirovibrionales bacterium]|nr:adenylosuccinate synthase [Vampirovibrionales bacterium]
MANVIVVGAQWGDEGKAKIVDLLAERADVVVRCQGGCNAGHTVQYNGETFKFHLIPSGLLYPGKRCVIGSGTVIDPQALLAEIGEMSAKGYATDGLKISDRAHVTLPCHIALDKALEASRDGGKIGTTGRGIGPTYMDKVGRLGVRIGDLYESDEILNERLSRLLQIMRPLLASLSPGENLDAYSVEAMMAFCRAYAEPLAPYVVDAVALLADTLAAPERDILFEGAQGALLDIDYGTYPFVTSSNATAGGACTGSGVGPTRIDRVIGVMKAYVTRVGEGPFPTELNDERGGRLQQVGQEFGATTGRVRRCGWFDAVIARFSAQVNGLDGLAITKLDVLDGFDEVSICVGYRNRLSGEMTSQFPSRLSALAAMEPVYETMPGWRAPVRGAVSLDALPIEARRYLDRLSELSGVPVAILSTGPGREETIVLDDPMRGQSTRQRPKITCA